MILMTVIARDAVASDHLVYSWPFPIGPDCEVTCGNDEQVVMCPAFMVGDRLGPGRHRWRTPDPTRPVGAFFVLTGPVDCAFDMTTSFVIPTTGQPVRLRARGSLQVRCADPGLLIAQFVGLPFDSVNDGILRSVSRSIERMLARLLTRRVVMAASPIAVTDPGMLPGIIEEVVAYNPTAGAVFGIELIRMGQLVIAADDGSSAQVLLPAQSGEWEGNGEPRRSSQPDLRSSQPDISLVDTERGRPKPEVGNAPRSTPIPPTQTSQSGEISGEIRMTKRHASVPPADIARAPIDKLAATSGEISRSRVPTKPPPLPEPPRLPIGTSPPGAGPADARPREDHPLAGAPRTPAVEMPRSPDEITQPGVKTPVPGSIRLTTPVPGSMNLGSLSSPVVDDSRGSILGIGMSHIGSGAVAGEIPTKVPPGARVLVPGPNGLMQSATVRQLLQGYYELEVGSSGETIWVPINGVVPE